MVVVPRGKYLPSSSRSEDEGFLFVPRGHPCSSYDRVAVESEVIMAMNDSYADARDCESHDSREDA